MSVTGTKIYRIQAISNPDHTFSSLIVHAIIYKTNSEISYG